MKQIINEHELPCAFEVASSQLNLHSRAEPGSPMSSKAASQYL